VCSGQRSALGAEANEKRQSRVGGPSAVVVGRGENDFSFRPTGRGYDAQGGGCMRCTWSGCASQSTAPMQGGANVRAPFKRRLRPTSGPWYFFYLLRFSNTRTLIFELVTFLMSKFHQLFHRDSWKHKEQLSFLAQLQIPKGLQVIIFGINLNLNLP
jgi:hypothetical protein